MSVTSTSGDQPDTGPVDSAGDPLLVVEDLKTHFEIPAGLVKAVDGVSFTLGRGKTLGVVGESGSGKTVLSRSIMGLNVGDNVITTGSVLYDGEQFVGKKPKQMRPYWGEEMAMVFQDPMTSLNPVVKVGRQLGEGIRKHHGVSKSEARAQSIELLRSVHIPEPETRIDNYPHEMSGGMRQRVCIAIALSCSPKLLFADEPTTALDVTVQHQILNELALQQRERHMTMILVTHDLGVVAGRSDEIAVMYAGRIVEKAPTKTLFANMQHPYTQALLFSIPKTTQPKHTRLTAIAGRPPDLINPPAGCKFSPRCPFVTDRCREEEPELVPGVAEGHEFRCHLPVGSRQAQEAYDANLKAGLPQTLAAAGRVIASEDLPDQELAS